MYKVIFKKKLFTTKLNIEMDTGHTGILTEQ